MSDKRSAKQLTAYLKKVLKKLKKEDFKREFYGEFKEGSIFNLKMCVIEEDEDYLFIWTSKFGNYIFNYDSLEYCEIDNEVIIGEDEEEEEDNIQDILIS